MDRLRRLYLRLCLMKSMARSLAPCVAEEIAEKKSAIVEVLGLLSLS